MPKLLSIQLYNNREKRFFLKTWNFFKRLDSFTRLMLITFILFILTTPFIVGNLQVFNPKAQTAATITLDSSTTFQTITGWVAGEQAAHDEHWFPDWPLYKNTLLDQAVNDLGINSMILSFPSGKENTRDFDAEFKAGTITNAENRCFRYSTVNDNADPNSINMAGFQFDEQDITIEQLILPMKQRVEANGEKFHLNLLYIAFDKQITGSGCPGGLQYHHTDAQEYAEFILAASLHLRNKYGLVPTTWEVLLEPDNTSFYNNGTRLGNAIQATIAKLEANGFTPKIIAPGTTDMDNAPGYFDGILGVLGAANVQKYFDSISYHRYGSYSLSSLQGIAARAKTHNIGAYMSEWIGADYNILHEDLKVGNNSRWNQFVLAFPTSDNGAQYYTISGTTVNIGSRTKFLRQYFKFIREGAVRIKADSTNNNFDPVAFINKNGKYVVVVKANSGGAFTVGGLPAGPYGITYTTGSQYNQSMPDVTITGSQAVNANIPSGGVITIYRR